jgi:hypothetical protein
MELTSEDAALLLTASENVHLKLKRERSGVHEINKLRRQCGEYHHTAFSTESRWGTSFFNILVRLYLFHILPCTVYVAGKSPSKQ